MILDGQPLRWMKLNNSKESVEFASRGRDVTAINDYSTKLSKIQDKSRIVEINVFLVQDHMQDATAHF